MDASGTASGERSRPTIDCGRDIIGGADSFKPGKEKFPNISTPKP